jgi:L-lactate dehydrogenase complex protein LldG
MIRCLARPGGEILYEFIEVLRSQGGVAHLAKDARETTTTLTKILEAESCKSVVVAKLPARVRGPVLAALRNVNYISLEEDQGPDPIDAIAKADMGITWAEYIIAEQGAVLEVATDDTVRLVSTLPRIHVVLASSGSALRDLREAMERVAETLQASSPPLPVLTVISGPSKTADIQMKLLYGVHGPHRVYAVLLEWL